MNNESIDRLNHLAFAGQATWLAVMKKLLRSIWNPHHALNVIHVAWTNGKWSTCAMLAQCLIQAWYSVGRFSSPHLITMHERVRLNEEMITDAQLELHLWEVFDLCDSKWVTISFFEALTLASVFFFLAQEVDYAVFEVGLWWTYDSTNIFPKPVATAITSIWIDHQKWLWDTRAQIQWNKMWIMKRGVPMFTPVNNALMHHAARIKWAELQIVLPRMYRDTSLSGDHQRSNAWVAWAILNHIWLSEWEITIWLMNVSHPWRLQRLDPNLLIDWAHNVQGVRALGDYLSSQEITDKWFKRIITVFWSVKNEQELRQIGPYLLKYDENYLVRVESERALPASVSEKILWIFWEFETIKDYDELFELFDRYRESSTLVVVYGSLYLVGALLKRYQ